MNSEELAGNVVSAAIDALRQTSMVPFWKSSIDVTPWKQVRELFDTSRLKEGRARKLLEDVLAQLAFESFKMEAKDARPYTGELLASVQVEVSDGHEWDEVFREAWKGVECPNEWCLSDNAARLLEWIQGPKNTREFTSQNRIGAQAGLKGSGSRSNIRSYLEEIGFKSPAGFWLRRGVRTLRISRLNSSSKKSRGLAGPFRIRYLKVRWFTSSGRRWRHTPACWRITC